MDIETKLELIKSEPLEEIITEQEPKGDPRGQTSTRSIT